MQIIDTHCHIHDSEFSDKFTQDASTMIAEAESAGVVQMVCVGTDVKSSKEAIDTATQNEQCIASIAIHPHEAEKLSVEQIEAQLKELEDLIASNEDQIVAIGECGLDYFYHESVEVVERQKLLFKGQIEIALRHDLPMIFHIREAFHDFFTILDQYDDVQGVVHSFTSTPEDAKECVRRGLYIGLNGIMTFTRDEAQLEAAKQVPLTQLLLETDAPFLTPKPFRGKVCTPKHIVHTATFLSELRGEPLEEITDKTTENAKKLFRIA